MNNTSIQTIFERSYDDFASNHYQTPVQAQTAVSILKCKTEKMGLNISQCTECGYTKHHYNSCRNRNCPLCQAVKKEVWVDKRKAEVIDTPYFHVVFTLPHELNSLIYHNQTLLYGLLHKCCADTILELAADKKYLGATPGIIQVLHTWNQELGYHVHMHCIISGGGLTPDHKIRKSSDSFFIPVKVLRDKFKGKFLFFLNQLYIEKRLYIPQSVKHLTTESDWLTFKDSLYRIDWCPYIKQTFNGFGNAIEYLGRYTHKVAISNSRIISVSDTQVSFSARAIKPGEPLRKITISNTEFIRRFLMHVLPSGFQKIRYYGFLNNRMKNVNLKLIFKLQGHQRFTRRLENMTLAEMLKATWNIDTCRCPDCGNSTMKPLYKSFKACG